METQREKSDFLLGCEVVHKKFGSGKITEMSPGFITVSFRDWGAHTFVYPDAFSSFLRIVDGAFLEKIEKDLSIAWEERANQELEQRKRVQAVVEQARLEKAAKRTKTAAKPRTKAAPSADAASKKKTAKPKTRAHREQRADAPQYDRMPQEDENGSSDE